MSWLSEFLGTDTNYAAINAQQNATNLSVAEQKRQYDQTRADNEPWRTTGVKYLGELDSQMGDLNRSFTMDDFQADPGYAFRLAEGQKAIERSAAARGGLNSGGTMKALARYGQDYASNEYTNAYNRFTNDQTNRFNRLSSLSGLGQIANQSNQQAGMNASNNISNAYTNMGNASAAGMIAGDNRRAGLINAGIGGIAAYYGAQGGGGGGVTSSDIRLKTNIKQIDPMDLKELKQSIKPYKWNYINESDGKGDWFGVMAQDLEKSKIGKTLIIEDKNGFKQIDLKKLASLFLATLAEG